MGTPPSSLSGNSITGLPSLHLTVIAATVIGLLVKRVWHRTLAGIQRMHLGGVSPERPSPATRLPFEVIEIIIAHIYDKRSLRSCTRTCRSWYIVALAHLHHTLIVDVDSRDRKCRWLNPICHMDTLGLLPLVRRFCVRRGRANSRVEISPSLLNYSLLPQFSAFANVRELEIDYLDIHSFPLRRYFGHFPSTVQSLILREPMGSWWHTIYFIGLFRHLQDLHLLYDNTNLQLEWEPARDSALVPLFVSPLQGWLKIKNFGRVDILKELIDLFGGIRFRHVLLFNVSGTRLLLNSCAKTLQTVVLFPSDPYGEQLSLKFSPTLAKDLAARYYLQDFDLSQNKSLQSLQIPASSIDCALAGGAASRFLEHVLSTIKSSAFLHVTVIYWDSDFRCRPHSHKMSRAEKAKEASRHHGRFGVLRGVREVREFQLVLSATVSGNMGECRLRMLEGAIAEEKAKNGFDENFSEPSVSYNPQMYRTGC